MGWMDTSYADEFAEYRRARQTITKEIEDAEARGDLGELSALYERLGKNAMNLKQIGDAAVGLSTDYGDLAKQVHIEQGHLRKTMGIGT